ncbi:MAG: hypothetical protein HQK61_10055 [Desulfamplus sp.]|nr:hypothetical protein [Desulfamplus sp.]
MKVGDVVRVKASVKVEGFDVNFGGWQGRISATDSHQNLICIDWDSVTLGNIPSPIITQCEEDGLGWEQMWLGIEDVEITTARDTELDVTQAVGRIQSEHRWDYLGNEGKNISRVLAGVDMDDEWTILQIWEEHLQKVLKFPFPAEVIEFQERSKFKQGDQVIVQGIEEPDEMYGILVKIKHKNGRAVFPLCDLEVKDTKSSSYGHVRDYVVWFANR